MRWHFIFVRIGVLFASRFGRKDCPLYQYSPVADYVLFAGFGNYTVNIVGITVARQISTIHNVSGRAERTRHYIHIKYPLP